MDLFRKLVFCSQSTGFLHPRFTNWTLHCSLWDEGDGFGLLHVAIETKGKTPHLCGFQAQTDTQITITSRANTGITENLQQCCTVHRSTPEEQLMHKQCSYANIHMSKWIWNGGPDSFFRAWSTVTFMLTLQTSFPPTKITTHFSRAKVKS